LKAAQIDALIAGYEAGKTMKDLAVEFGINRLTVSAHLRRAGVPLRRAVSTRSKPPKLPGSTTPVGRR
jgi:hypothetical protein